MAHADLPAEPRKPAGTRPPPLGQNARAGAGTIIKAVLFDMDGLLLDTERLVHEAAVETAEGFGLPDMRSVFLGMIGLRGRESDAVLERALDGRVPLEDFCRVCDQQIEARMQHGIPVKPGVVDLLSALSVAGIPAAVASSSRRASIERHLSNAGLLGHFQTLTGGDDVIRAKPDPEIYHTAAASLGVETAHCAAFEDSDYGTRAAVASGARTVQIPDMVAPTAALRALGHIIAPDLITGARLLGLIPTSGIAV